MPRCVGHNLPKKTSCLATTRAQREVPKRPIGRSTPEEKIRTHGPSVRLVCLVPPKLLASSNTLCPIGHGCLKGFKIGCQGSWALRCKGRKVWSDRTTHLSKKFQCPIGHDHSPRSKEMHASSFSHSSPSPIEREPPWRTKCGPIGPHVYPEIFGKTI